MRRLLLMTTVLILLGAAGIAWWLRQGHRSVAPPARPVPLDARGVEIRLNKVRIHGVSGGKIVWEVEAENFNMEKNSPRLRMNGLKKVALLNGDKQELLLSAASLERNTFTGDITLQGPVTVESDRIVLRTQTVQWDARQEQLSFPQPIRAQIGDFLLSTEGTVSYDVAAATLRCRGGLRITANGNTLRAGSAVVHLNTLDFSLSGPGSAELNVTDLEAWAGGQSLPAIAPIPGGVQQRYREYCQQQDARKPRPAAPRPTLTPRGGRP